MHTPTLGDAGAAIAQLRDQGIGVSLCNRGLISATGRVTDAHRRLIHRNRSAMVALLTLRAAANTARPTDEDAA